MNKKPFFITSDYLFLGAAFASFLFSIFLWFMSSKEQGLFVGLWVPSIISLGVYFRVLMINQSTQK